MMPIFKRNSLYGVRTTVPLVVTLTSYWHHKFLATAVRITEQSIFVRFHNVGILVHFQDLSQKRYIMRSIYFGSHLAKDGGDRASP